MADMRQKFDRILFVGIDTNGPLLKSVSEAMPLQWSADKCWKKLIFQHLELDHSEDTQLECEKYFAGKCVMASYEST